MHVQIVTFNLGRMSEGEYIDVASRLAPRFAGLPGLLAKVWLESPESGVYGAIYLWDDVEAMDRFLATDLFEGTNAAFTNLTVDDFSVLENLTRATQPVLTLVEDPAPRGRAPSPRQGTPATAAPVGA
ncbi:MAG: YdhR family protein, partial [Actinomycetota bacterium]|nr:YdhR family protein [Actinomycetota bacterium]